MSTIRCRLATLVDADAIADLHAASWRTTYRGAMRDAYLDGDVGAERQVLWRERLADPAPNQHVIVAEAGNAVAGFACAYGGANATWGTELDNLHVVRAAQSRGVGARLLRATARWTRAVHPDGGLYLQVLDGNTGARRFYERYGARDAEADHWHAPDGSAIPVRRYVWPPPACAVLAAPNGVAIAEATTTADYALARTLFEEYAAWLAEDICFQGFAAELETLPVMYGPPAGALLLARRANEPLACVGVRALPSEPGTCEMKRLFVRDSARGLGVGWDLAAAAVATGRRLGYRRMVLDTLDRMGRARELYAALDFTEIPPYYANPLSGVRYLARDL